MTAPPFKNTKYQGYFAVLMLLVGSLIIASNIKDIPILFLTINSISLGLIISFIGLFYLVGLN